MVESIEEVSPCHISWFLSCSTSASELVLRFELHYPLLLQCFRK